MDHLLLQSMRRLAVSKHSRPSLGCPDSCLMKMPQLPKRATRGLPPCNRWDNECGSAQGTPISDELLDQQSDGTPLAPPLASRMDPLARAERDDFARPHCHSAPNRRRPIAQG